MSQFLYNITLQDKLNTALNKLAIKNKLTVVILVCAVILGVTARMSNLSDARFHDKDEYRSSYVFYNIKSPFLAAVYKIPVLLFGNRHPHEVLLYTSAFWGVISCLSVYGLGKTVFNEEAGSYAAFILSIMGVHVHYSRTGYAAVFQSFVLLGVIWLLVLYFKENKRIRLVFSGLLLGVAFLIYAGSYAAIGTIFILFPFIEKLRQTPPKKIIVNLAILGTMSFIPLLVFEAFSHAVNQGSYFISLLYYQKGVGVGAPKSFLELLALFQAIIKYGGIAQLAVIVAGFFYGITGCLRAKEEKSLFLLGFITLSYLVFCTMGMSGVHSVFSRKIVFLIPFLCICSGFLLYKIELITHKYVILVFLAVFSFLFIPQWQTIIETTFKIKPVTEWLEQRAISKNSITTAMDIYETGDVLKTVNIPKKLVILHQQRAFQLEWKGIKAFYEKKGIRYLLTSGFGSDAGIGLDDPVLKRINPLKIWILPGHGKISIYDLANIFPKGNQAQL